MTSLVLALCVVAAPLSAQQLEIRFLDVGQGDAALIREGGKTVLIDAGPSARIESYLREFGVDTIALVVASHNHSDHIGGMTTVLSSAVVRFYLDNGIPHTTATYQRTIRAVRASGAQYLAPTARSITLGTAVVRVLPPASSGDQNNGSVGIVIEYGQFRALLTGDSEREELTAWLDAGDIPCVNVVKVAHHGSHNGTTADWISTTRPQIAVISVGRGNSYGHPAGAAVTAWQQAGARVYRTDRDRSVLVLANDDGSFVVTTANVDPRGVVQFHPFTQDTVAAAVARPVQSRGSACNAKP